MKLGTTFVFCAALTAVQISHAEERESLSLAAPDSGTQVKRTPEQQRAFENGCATQRDVTICAGYDYEVLNERLNILYGKMQSNVRASAAEKKRLAVAQRAWLKYMDADCLSQLGPKEEAGTGWDADWLNCRSRHIKTRIERLENLWP